MDRRDETAYGDAAGVSVDVNRVVSVGAIDDDAVGCTVADGAAEATGEIDVELIDVGPGSGR